MEAANGRSSPTSKPTVLSCVPDCPSVDVCTVIRSELGCIGVTTVSEVYSQQRKVTVSHQSHQCDPSKVRVRPESQVLVTQSEERAVMFNSCPWSLSLSLSDKTKPQVRPSSSQQVKRKVCKVLFLKRHLHSSDLNFKLHLIKLFGFDFWSGHVI